MTIPSHLRNIGDRVVVLDQRGEYLTRGTIFGVHRIDPPHYDVAPYYEASMAKRLCSIPESRIRGVAKEYLAYERQIPGNPRHIKDFA